MSIVTVNVSQTSAPKPNLQQKKGAFISQGGTTLQPNSVSFLTASGDLAAILQAPLALTSLAWLAGVVTATTAAAHGIPNGAVVQVVISGAAPAGYNGTFTATVTGASTFTYPLVANPGAETTPGSWAPYSAVELVSMNTTFWAQGSSQGVWVLELGKGSAAAGVAALSAYITNNTVKGNAPFYAYLPPAAWADEPTFPTFAATKSSLTGKTYFFQTMSLTNYVNFNATMKSVFGLVPSPAAPATEFSIASAFWALISQTPSATNKITPFDNTAVSGVTAYPDAPQANFVTITGANANVITTGAEGGLTSLIIQNGTTMDGRDLSYWYSVDWVQTTVQQQVAAAVINGSNNPQNPLYYNQQGINDLQGVIKGVMAQGVSFGLVLGAPIQLQLDPATFISNLDSGLYAGQTPINAQDFVSYSIANPNDYGNGVYSGFQIAYTPARGFKSIVININVTDFVAA